MRIEISGLTKSYRGGVCALDGLDLVVPTGMFGLLGANGAGKTTLMRILAGIARPTSGRVTVGGHDLALLADRGAPHRRQTRLDRRVRRPEMRGQAEPEELRPAQLVDEVHDGPCAGALLGRRFARRPGQHAGQAEDRAPQHAHGVLPVQALASARGQCQHPECGRANAAASSKT